MREEIERCGDYERGREEEVVKCLCRLVRSISTGTKNVGVDLPRFVLETKKTSREVKFRRRKEERRRTKLRELERG